MEPQTKGLRISQTFHLKILVTSFNITGDKNHSGLKKCDNFFTALPCPISVTKLILCSVFNLKVLMVNICTIYSDITEFGIFPYSLFFMLFVPQTTVILLNRIRHLSLLMDTHCVLCEVRTVVLYARLCNIRECQSDSLSRNISLATHIGFFLLFAFFLRRVFAVSHVSVTLLLSSVCPHASAVLSLDALTWKLI